MWHWNSITVLLSSVQFSSRWYLCVRNIPYALHPVPQKFPHHCLWNGSYVRLIDDGPLSSFQGRSSSTSSWHSSADNVNFSRVVTTVWRAAYSVKTVWQYIHIRAFNWQSMLLPDIISRKRSVVIHGHREQHRLHGHDGQHGRRFSCHRGRGNHRRLCHRQIRRLRHTGGVCWVLLNFACLKRMCIF